MFDSIWTTVITTGQIIKGYVKWQGIGGSATA